MSYLNTIMILIREAKSSDIHSIVDFQIKMALETEQLRLSSSVVNKGVQAVFNDTSKGRLSGKILIKAE